MNRHGNGRQVEVVEQQWQVTVEPPGGSQVKVERPLADTLQLLVQLWTVGGHMASAVSSLEINNNK